MNKIKRNKEIKVRLSLIELENLIIKQLRMIGNNLNQIAVIGYKTGTIDILKYKRNCSELEKNVQLILSNVTEPTRMEK